MSILVPKLCLGTPLSKLRFVRAVSCPFAKQSFRIKVPNRVWEPGKYSRRDVNSWRDLFRLPWSASGSRPAGVPRWIARRQQDGTTLGAIIIHALVLEGTRDSQGLGAIVVGTFAANRARIVRQRLEAIVIRTAGPGLGQRVAQRLPPGARRFRGRDAAHSKTCQQGCQPSLHGTTIPEEFSTIHDASFCEGRGRLAARLRFRLGRRSRQ
jgi:hypothetical protein